MAKRRDVASGVDQLATDLACLEHANDVLQQKLMELRIKFVNKKPKPSSTARRKS